ncbi:MAG: GNAT family N-acetyltransferase [Alphaproteobacteria bacterium]|nr:GNAT family N-acetyltransferase [Alphaproteobacteria bacterium]
MPTAKPTLRQALPRDLGVVEDIVRAAYSRYIARIGRKPAPMLDDYAALIAQGRVTLAEIEGAAEAIVVLIPEADTMLLDNIAVAPAFQGQGLGRYLLAHAETEAVKTGFCAIRLYTHEAMHENIALYKRVGYVETHRAEEKGMHRIYMRKELGAEPIP